MSRLRLNLREVWGQHKRNAKFRGIEFLMSFEEWLMIWKDSGHMHERGNGSGKYVMCRIGDKGPYAVGNVRIALFQENSKEGVVNYPHAGWRQPAGSEEAKRLKIYRRGKPHSAETKAKMSLASRGNKRRLGYKDSEEVKDKKRQANLQRWAKHREKLCQK